MDRKKLFIENIFVYGFIGILNRIIPFIFLPVVVRMLPNPSDFGIYNMYGTITGFGIPIAVLGLGDAMFREYFEKEDTQYKYNVVMTTFKVVIFSSSIMSIILALSSNFFSMLIFNDSSYRNIVIFSSIGIFLGSINTIVQIPTRIKNERKKFIFSGLMEASIVYGLSILFIKFGFSYLGLVCASLTGTLSASIFFFLSNHEFFSKGMLDKELVKNLLKLGLPLVPTFAIYWVYNSFDKIIIMKYLGSDEVGIYSLGAKFAQISQLIYAAFAGGYSYFKYKTMNDKDQVEMNSKLFEYLSIISILALLAIAPFIKPVFEFLFTAKYGDGFKVVIYLFMSPLLLMLYQVISSQFMIIKKSYISSLVLSIGAILNIILNIILINRIGIESSAISNLAGYILSLIVIYLIAKNANLLKFNLNHIILLIIFTSYILIYRFFTIDKFLMSLLVSILYIIIIIFIYRKLIFKTLHLVFKKYKK